MNQNYRYKYLTQEEISENDKKKKKQDEYAKALAEQIKINEDLKKKK